VAQYRYGLVLILVVCAVVLAIGAPDGNASRAAVFAIVGAALLVAIATSRERTVVLRRRALLGGTVIVVITVLTAVGALAHWVTLGVGAVMTLAVPATLAGGLLRLVRDRGATVQAVAGGIAIYLLLGLAFASAIGFVEAVQSASTSSRSQTRPPAIGSITASRCSPPRALATSPRRTAPAGRLPSSRCSSGRSTS
jgi:hypothetical protein